MAVVDVNTVSPAQAGIHRREGRAGADDDQEHRAGRPGRDTVRGAGASRRTDRARACRCRDRSGGAGQWDPQRDRDRDVRARARDRAVPHRGRNLRRGAVPREGLPRRGRGRALHRGKRVPERPCTGRGQRVGAPLPRRGPRVHRQDEHPGVRNRTDHRAAAVRPDPQPVGYRANLGRLQRRRGGGGLGPRGADGARQRRRRLDPHPRVVLRAGGPEAEPGPGPPRPPLRRSVLGPRQRARSDAQRARHRRAARCGRGSGGRRPVLPRAARAVVHQ